MAAITPSTPYGVSKNDRRELWRMRDKLDGIRGGRGIHVVHSPAGLVIHGERGDGGRGGDPVLKVVRVKATGSGSNGTATTKASYTYNLYDILDSDLANPIAQSIGPQHRQFGPVDQPANGAFALAFLYNGDWLLLSGETTGEILQVQLCADAAANTIAPSAPASPSGTGVTDTTASLTWTANAETDLNHYNIYRGTSSGGPYTKVNTEIVTTNSYTDTNLTPGTTYYYVIRAVDTQANESSNSAQVTRTTTNANPPAAPTGLATGAVSTTTVALDWNDNTEPDLASYRIYHATAPGGPYTLNTSGLTSSDGTATGLSPGTTYYFVVRAVDTNSNESANSNEVSEDTMP